MQHIRKGVQVSETTEDDAFNSPIEKQFKHACDKERQTYPTKHGPSFHKVGFCKGRRIARKLSYKGTVADRIILWFKDEKH